jgi:uncharacterized protein (TIGR02001 family)
MNKAVLSAMALALSAGAAAAADLRASRGGSAVASYYNPWDVAFGAALLTEYNFRGISQSNNRPSAWSYFEARYNPWKDLQLYAGVAGESISYPNRAAAEIDFYGGIRPTFGSLTLDFGYWYYYYPGGQTFGPVAGAVAPALPNGNVVKGVLSYWEVYAKATIVVADVFTFGTGVYHAPNWTNMGGPGTYGQLTAKLAAPSGMLPKDFGAYLSAELSHYWLGQTDAFYAVPAFPTGVDYPDYTAWNIGLAFTWKVLTLDLRYYDTDLTKANCNVITSDHTATFNPANVTLLNPGGLGSNWCSSRFIVKLAADVSAKDHLK